MRAVELRGADGGGGAGLLGPQLPPSWDCERGPGVGGHHLRLRDDCGIGCHSGRRENGTEMEAGAVAPRSLAHVLPRPLC